MTPESQRLPQVVFGSHEIGGLQRSQGSLDHVPLDGPEDTRHDRRQRETRLPPRRDPVVADERPPDRLVMAATIASRRPAW